MKRGNIEVYDAIREIEQIEDELNEMDGLDELRKRLTDARADLVDRLVGEEFEELDLRRRFSQQVEDAPSGATIIFDEAQGTVETRKDATDVKRAVISKKHPDVRTRAELPEKNVNGDPIEYVWVVYRPAANSHVGEVELLGAHDNAESAKKHAAVANRAGEVEIKPMNIQGEGNPLAE